MATANNAYGVDPTDPYNQVRQRMLAQQYQDPTVPADTGTVPSKSAASPDFAQPSAVQDFASRQPGVQTPAPAPAPAPAPTTPDTTDTTNRTTPPTSNVPSGPPVPGTNPQPNVASPAPTPAAATPKPPSYDDVNAAYQKYLGRPLTQQEYGQFYNWSGNPSDAQRNWEWTIAHSPEAQAYAAAHPPPAGAGASGVVPPANPFNDQIRQLIMKQLATAGGPVDPNNPEISSTLSAARDEASRQTDQERTALAERLYAQGIGTGGTGTLGSNELTQQIQQSGERNAGALSTLRGQLLQNEYNQKNTQLQNLLSLAVQSGDAESARAIQAQIANLQAAIAREGLGVNLGEFGAALNQNSALAGLKG